MFGFSVSGCGEDVLDGFLAGRVLVVEDRADQVVRVERLHPLGALGDLEREALDLSRAPLDVMLAAEGGDAALPSGEGDLGHGCSPWCLRPGRGPERMR